jgi:hypothetical protein
MIAVMRFSRSPCPWKLTAALHHHRQRANGICLKMHVRSTGGRSGSCFRRIGLRGNSDRGHSDLGHDTHYAFKLARSVTNAPNARARTFVKPGCYLSMH